MFPKIFGKNPSGARLKRIETSPYYKNGVFANVEFTEVTSKNVSTIKMWKDFFNKPKTVTPSRRMPSVKTDLKKLNNNRPTVVWFGHSSYFIKSNTFTILIDPVFVGHASPFSSMVKAFDGTDIYTVDDLPVIDLLIITHDHYDHLDFVTVNKLKGRVKKIVTSLGVGEHLTYWGINSQIITEMDWWEHTTIEKDIELTSTPARHFSGRKFTRAKTLWSSFVLSIHGIKIFIGGDSGYDKQFEQIGIKYGPFDLAILDCGQYGKDWPLIHMIPEETVQAAIDLKAKVLLPVHWGKFALASHPWNEPIIRAMVAAKEKECILVTPKIGEPYEIGGPVNEDTWWQ